MKIIQNKAFCKTLALIISLLMLGTSLCGCVKDTDKIVFDDQICLEYAAPASDSSVTTTERTRYRWMDLKIHTLLDGENIPDKINRSDENGGLTQESEKNSATVGSDGEQAVGGNPDTIKLYDVPLTEEQQRHAIEMAEKYGIDVVVIFGVMYVESRYRVNAISSNGKYIGMMQIAKSNLKRLNRRLGITDLTDFEQNVESGAYFLGYYYRKYGNLNKALMCYHCGEGGAYNRWNSGNYEDGYCRKVKKEMERIKAAMES